MMHPKDKWVVTGEAAYQNVITEGMQVEVDPDGTLTLKILNRQAVNVPPGCTLSITNNHVNGKVKVTVEGEGGRSLAALKANNKTVTTDLTNPS